MSALVERDGKLIYYERRLKIPFYLTLASSYIKRDNLQVNQNVHRARSIYIFKCTHSTKLATSSSDKISSILFFSRLEEIIFRTNYKTSIPIKFFFITYEYKSTYRAPRSEMMCNFGKQWETPHHQNILSQQVSAT